MKRPVKLDTLFPNEKGVITFHKMLVPPGFGNDYEIYLKLLYDKNKVAIFKNKSKL